MTETYSYQRQLPDERRPRYHHDMRGFRSKEHDERGFHEWKKQQKDRPLETYSYQRQMVGYRGLDETTAIHGPENKPEYKPETYSYQRQMPDEKRPRYHYDKPQEDDFRSEEHHARSFHDWVQK